MTKLIIITLLSALPLFATMQMQTIQTKKVVVGTFKSGSDTLQRAKKTLLNNGVLQRIKQHNNFVMTTRTNAGTTTLILEKFKTMRMALDAFVAVSKHYPKAYLIDDSYKVALEMPNSPLEPPAAQKSISAPVVPTITEDAVLAAATAEISQDVLPESTENNPDGITKKAEEPDAPVIIVVTEAGSEAERLAIEKALEKNSTLQDNLPSDTVTTEDADAEEVVITEIEEIALDEPNVTQQSSATNSTVSSTSIDEERYKRKPKDDQSILSPSILIYTLLAVIVILLLLLWRRSRDVDVHKILGDQQRR